jgi:hypothetical protein
MHPGGRPEMSCIARHASANVNAPAVTHQHPKTANRRPPRRTPAGVVDKTARGSAPSPHAAPHQEASHDGGLICRLPGRLGPRRWCRRRRCRRC